MKKSILSITLIASLFSVVLFSCKKDDKEEFQQTDVTGTAVLKGNVNKRVITPDGNGNWTNTSVVNVKNVNVTVKVNKGQAGGLYPNSTSAGADVYTATTDSAGNYAITIRTNATGVNAMLTIEGFTGTQDTIINGVTKKGLYAIFNGVMNTINVTIGQNIQNNTTNHTFIPTNVSSNPNNIVIGSAIVTGSIGTALLTKQTSTSNPVLATPMRPVPANTIVYLTFDKDPTVLANKVYQTTTSANGSYTFNVSTVAMGTPGFSQTATVWVADFASSRDTVSFNNTTPTGTITGLQGVYGQMNTSRTGVYTSSIKNAVNLSLTSFTAN